MRVGSLCTGYGGLEMGLAQAGFEIDLAFVADKDPAAEKLLDHHHPSVPNLGDITEVDWSKAASVDWLLAGYPCQGFSLAGQRKGTEDERFIWPTIADAIRILRPRHVLLENVPGHRSLGFGRVLGDLASMRYVGSWVSVRASDVGAAHKRERVFIYAQPADARPMRVDVIRGAVAGRAYDELSLIPTPAARLGRATSITPATALRQAAIGKMNLDDWGALLPTPRASPNENRSTKPTPSQLTGRHGRYLATEVLMLPTPRATDGPKGGPNQRGSSGDLMLPAAVQPGRWGMYGAAIERWAVIIGRSAPEPVGPTRGAGVRLAPVFVEWMMGLEPGWVTGTPGLTRNDQLRLLGNGVVPLQAAYAIRQLAERQALR